MPEEERKQREEMECLICRTENGAESRGSADTAAAIANRRRQSGANRRQHIEQVAALRFSSLGESKMGVREQYGGKGNEKYFHHDERD